MGETRFAITISVAHFNGFGYPLLEKMLQKVYCLVGALAILFLGGQRKC